METKSVDTAKRSSWEKLQIALGLVWLLDGALQFQPFMFTKGFVNQILLPSAQGNPGWVSDPTISIAHYIEPHIAAWNAFFAALQVLIGICIAGGALTRRPAITKIALLGSMAWALLVWWLSEGLGGILQEGSPLSGAPGAVILYGLIAILLWPPSETAYLSPQIEKAVSRPAGDTAPNQPSANEAIAASPNEEEAERQLPSRLSTARYLMSDLRDHVTSNASAKIIWAVLWIFNGFLLLEPSNQMPQAVSSSIKTAMSGQPGWLHGLLAAAASALSGTGSWIDSLLAVAMIVIGAAVAFNLYPRAMLSASIVISLAIWIFGEGLGGILTGQGTDPNSGLLWVILAGCLWARLSITDERLLHRTSGRVYSNSGKMSIGAVQRETVYSGTSSE